MADLNRKTTTTTKTKNNDIEYIILRKNAEILGLDIPTLKLVENMLVDKNTTVKEKTLFFIKSIDDINKSVNNVNNESN